MAQSNISSGRGQYIKAMFDIAHIKALCDRSFSPAFAGQ